MNLPFVVFGSPSSQDADILVFVERIPSIQEAKELCVSYQKILQDKFTKPANVNLGVVANGVLTSVCKGSVDEVNNSLIDTYGFHEQSYALPVTTRVARDVDDKVLRAVRIVLSTLSRSQHRVIVKDALKGNIVKRIDALDSIDLSEALRDTKYPMVDIYKTLAFQMGQSLGLLVGQEYYSKESIASAYPTLKPFLMREAASLRDLESFKQGFVAEVRNYLPKMNKFDENLKELL